MSKVIMIGCDLHDRSMLLRYAIDMEEPQQLTFKNDATDRKRMISRLKSLAKKSGVKRIVFAYEASGLGYRLADQIRAEGMECHVLSPTHLAAYLGLCPASYESGETNDRKGRITRQGPARLRRMLCQAAWTSVVHCEQARQEYQRIKQGQKKRTKKALVALMRKLGIRMWHTAMSAGVSIELQGRGGPNELVEAA